MEYYNLTQLAKYVGVSRQTIHAWLEKKWLLKAEKQKKKGGNFFRLYTKEQAEAIKKAHRERIRSRRKRYSKAAR